MIVFLLPNLSVETLLHFVHLEQKHCVKHSCYVRGKSWVSVKQDWIMERNAFWYVQLCTILLNHLQFYTIALCNSSAPILCGLV